MTINFKTLGAAAVASFTLAGVASADVCDTPSALGDLGRFDGEVITIAGSMEGKDEEMLTNTVSCFEKATGAVVKYSGSRDFAGIDCCRPTFKQRTKHRNFPTARFGR